MRARLDRQTIPVRSRLLVPAAATCGALWVGAVAIAGLDIRGRALILLCVAGALATLVLLLVIQRHHTRIRGLAGTDALTGLVNHRSFHEILAAELARAADRTVSAEIRRAVREHVAREKQPAEKREA